MFDREGCFIRAGCSPRFLSSVISSSPSSPPFLQSGDRCADRWTQDIRAQEWGGWMECRERRVRRVNLEGEKPEEREQQQRFPVFLLAGKREVSFWEWGG